MRREGQIYVEISGSSTWTLSGNSYITGLTCETNSINLNGYTLYVNGTAYTEGNASTGSAIEISSGSSSEGNGGNSSGNDDRPTPPDGGNTSGDNKPDFPGGNSSGDNKPSAPDGSESGGESSGEEESGTNDTSMIFDSSNFYA